MLLYKFAHSLMRIPLTAFTNRTSLTRASLTYWRSSAKVIFAVLQLWGFVALTLGCKLASFYK